MGLCVLTLTPKNAKMGKTMKKIHYAIVILMIFLGGTLGADDYQWDLVNALVRGDFQRIESIMRENANTMSAFDRRIVMNFT